MSNQLHRGNLLWEGSRMFLPEHREMLMEQRQKKREYQAPELSEDQWEEMSYLLQEALAEGRPLLVTYATRYAPEQFCGFVEKVDQWRQQIQICNGEQEKVIPFAKLLGMEWP
ncbi:YolD-like family protein [Risungbinella massiliensis]|uniref:YolD-like family protein n=1 Tax=Risungbinella massiliensis TaxID=1329796 RepID=UPI0005CBF9D6|nr:YolD-like family protein [Risungbinella massiliensis]